MNKKIFLTLILGILLVVTVSALTLNSGNFDSKVGLYGKYEIKNLFGTKLMDLELKENTIKCVDNECHAIFDITLHKSGELVEDVRFYKLTDAGWVLKNIRDYSFYLSNSSTSNTVDTFKTVCSTSYTLNLTSYQTCSRVKDGTKTVTTHNWNPIDISQTYAAGNYTLKMIGNKKPSWTIDWQIKSRGIWTDQWAIWGSTVLSNQTIGYFNMDETSGTVLEDLSPSEENMTSENGSTNFGRNAVINTAPYFNGSVGFVNTGYDELDNIDKGSYSISLWFNSSTSTATEALISHRTSGTANYSDIMMVTNGTVRFHTNNPDEQIYSTNDLDDGDFYHIVAIRDCPAGNMLLYVNGSLQANGSNSCNELEGDLNFGQFQSGGTSIFQDGVIDEVGLWNRTLTSSEVSSLYNSGSGLAYPFGGVLDFNSPTEGSSISTSEVEFNITATAIDSNITNVSLYTNESGSWVLRNSTIGLNASSVTQTWNRTIADNFYIWNIEICDVDADCAFGNVNATFTLDSASPTISIASPNETFDYLFVASNLSLNVTVTDLSLDACWYDYNGTNTTYTCATGVEQNESFTQEANNFNITVYANDTFGNLASSTSTWNFKVFENNRTFQASTIEGTSETFVLNYDIGSGVQTSLVNLFYNNTGYSSTFSTAGDITTTNNIIVAPALGAAKNITFFWNIILDDATNINTTTSNQTVSSLSIDNCSTNTNLIYNYSLIDEENQFTLQNTSMEISLALFNPQRTVTVLNFSQLYNDTNPAQICLSTALLNTTNYSVDSTVKYSSNHTGIEYALEYYNILNSTLNNASGTQNINLFDLVLADTTEFRLTYRDEDLALARNILIDVDRQYVAENAFKTVERPITDSNGQSVLHLVRNDIIYNFIMTNAQGDVVATFNNIIAFCQDFTIGDCNIDLNAVSTPDIYYDHTSNVGISFSISYSNTTELITLEFLSNDLTSRSVNMFVVRNNQFGNRTVCNETLLSASGLITCNVSSVVETDQFLFIEITADGVYVATETINIGSDTFNFGVSGYFFAFLFILIIITIFMEDRQTLVISLIIGWVIVISLGIMQGALLGSVSAGIWLIVTSMIFFWKLKKEDQT